MEGKMVQTKYSLIISNNCFDFSRKKLINNMMMALELVIAIIDDQLIALYHDKTMSLFPSVEQQQITYVKNNL